MTEEQLKELIDHGTYRLGQGDRVFVHVDGLARPLSAFSLDLNDDGTVDVYTERRQNLYRLAPERIVALQFAQDE